MTDQSYRTLPRIANSDLSDLERYLHPGKDHGYIVPLSALPFGSAFHKVILEPENWGKADVMLFANHQMVQLANMHNAVYEDGQIAHYIANGHCETVRQWQHEETGLPLKGKLDLVVMPTKRLLIDLKTTSCKTMEKFKESIVAYNYDRQAAFYLDSDPVAQYFEFVGVQKQAPYGLFRVGFHRSDEVIQVGREKMDRLLRLAKIELDKASGWRPKSWAGKEMLAV